MILTKKQEEGLKIAVQRYKEGQPWTCIAGYAGTGKSTLVKFIIAALGVDPEEDVAYVTFTGKAASVLRHKGNPNAMTAHKLLYYSTRTPNGKFIFKPRPMLDKNFQVIVVDEISMLPKDLWDLMLKHKKYIIACGDPFQLPPIKKDTDNHVLDKPHIFLDEIMRQAQESEIIRLTMDIRAYKPINYFQGEEVQVLPAEDLSEGMYKWADQIICATNRRRHEVNEYIRAMQGKGALPEIGDKVICCQNCWDILDETQQNALVNGTIGYIKEIELIEKTYPFYSFPKVPIAKCTIESELDGTFYNVFGDQKALAEGVKFLTPQQEFRIYKNPALRPEMPIELNYGHAITGHKAQGSQWGKVLVLEENFPFNREEHARWLYTVCTRPEEKLVLLR